MKTSQKFAALAAIATIGSAALSGSAHAGLNGTTMTMSVTHAGPFAAMSAITNQTYTYGSPSAFVAPGWGTLNVTSPVAPPPAGFDNSIKLDFTNFGYAAFAAPGFATVGTVKLLNLAEPFDLSSVKILINGVDKTVTKSAVGNGFQASWNTADVIAANPTAPNVVVAWNSSVPAPGAMALLGLAGLTARGRRRR